MGVFERYLTIWVGGAISVGVGLGSLFPAFCFPAKLLELEMTKFRMKLKIQIESAFGRPSAGFRR